MNPMNADTPLWQQPEGKQPEFKRDLSSPQNVLKTLVAFANSAEGRLVIGVDDARRVVGVADPLADEERICHLIADAIAPRVLPNVEFMSVGDTTVRVVEVFPRGAHPHDRGKRGPKLGVCLRLGSSNRQARPDWMAETRRTAAAMVLDEQPMLALSVQDLDLDAMARWFGPQRPLHTARLQTLKLLWGREREQHFPDAWVQCGRFRGRDKVDIFDQQDIHAHLRPRAGSGPDYHDDSRQTPKPPATLPHHAPGAGAAGGTDHQGAPRPMTRRNPPVSSSLFPLRSTD